MSTLLGAPRRRRGSAGLAAAAALAWIAGLIVFSKSLPPPGEPGAEVEAVIVLTGGEGRIDAALDLLEGNPEARLLISGVGEGVRARDLGPRAERHSDRIDLGRTAFDTIDNARESREWAEGLGVARAALVTGTTHMPRSLLAFGNLAPGLEVVPHPVPGRDEEDVNAAKIGPLVVLATEYTKYLLASAYFAFQGLL